MKPWSKTTRNRLLWLASLLDRRAAAIRKLVKARTPPRKAKADNVVELAAGDMFEGQARGIGTIRAPGPGEL